LGYKRALLRACVQLTELILIGFIASGCSKQQNQLIITFTKKVATTFSLHPKAADEISNLFVLELSIGTLFSSDPIASIADSITQNPDGLTWTLHLKPHFFDETGAHLNPTYWKRSMSWVSKNISDPKNMILLSKLEGWEEYIAGHREIPIEANDATMEIKLRFKSPPDGIQQYLSFPLLGFWSGDTQEFRSTGSYSIKSNSSESVRLELRSNAKTKKYPARILIRSAPHSYGQQYTVAPNEIVLPSSEDSAKGQHQLLKTSPTTLVFAEINHKSVNLRSQPSIASGLYQSIRSFRKKSPYSTTVTLPTSSVYFDVQSDEDDVPATSTHASRKLPQLTVLVYGVPGAQIHPYFEKIIKEAISPFAEQIILSFIDASPEAWEKVIERKYDVRLGSVEAGTYPDRWVTEMMFCTSQGITFIDPSRTICSAIKQRLMPTATELGRFLNHTLAKHETLIPLYNKSNALVIGSAIDPSEMSARSMLPRIHQVKFR
jgi:hypothetical protein